MRMDGISKPQLSGPQVGVVNGHPLMSFQGLFGRTPGIGGAGLLIIEFNNV